MIDFTNHVLPKISDDAARSEDRSTSGAFETNRNSFGIIGLATYNFVVFFLRKSSSGTLRESVRPIERGI